MAIPIISHELNEVNQSHPYFNAAHIYRDAGWVAPIPVDMPRPGMVIPGTTGAKNFHNFPPSPGQINVWRVTHGHLNIGLWMPDDVIGIDVDAYGDKVGASTIEWLETNITRESLPPTWTSTCRGARQPSRIYFYRVPPGRAWTSIVNIKSKEKPTLSDVEIIQKRHRWARVWPSVKTDKELPVQGLTYRWYDPNDHEMPEWCVPNVNDLPVLSSAWQQVFRRRSNERMGSSDMLNLNRDEAINWIEHLPPSLNDQPCITVRATLTIWLDRLSRRAGARHDTMVHGVWALIRDGIEGHRGVADALSQLHEEFMHAISSDDSRAQGAGDAEWWRAVRDGVNRNAVFIAGKTVHMCQCHAKERWAVRRNGDV